jgi:hypothetical protein
MASVARKFWAVTVGTPFAVTEMSSARFRLTLIKLANGAGASYIAI